jgi:glycosyltransferase involved in cell wall biosynthesis
MTMYLKKVLLITYHFPPSAASGSFRLLGFARHLPASGWQPLVVAPPCLPWEPIDTQLLDSVPADAMVTPVAYPTNAPKLLRAFAQNAIWLPRAWSACKRVVGEHRPDVILTSGPPHCVHVLGHYLKRRTGLPWVADFRDPWISDGTDKRLGWMQRWALRWERTVFQNADLILANAPNARRMFQGTYPAAADKVVTLTNGFDPCGAQGRIADPSCEASQSTRLLHAGEIYAGRDPLPLFETLAELNAQPDSFVLKVLGRNEIDLDKLLRERGWSDFVYVEGQRSYQDSLEEMRQADILVLFDSPGRKIGVPAKLYEYLGAGRPILALAEPDGDTGAVLRQSGVLHRIASPGDRAQIRQALVQLTEALGTTQTVADPALLANFTRANLTRMLACRLDVLIGQTVEATRDDGCAAVSTSLQEIES